MPQTTNSDALQLAAFWTLALIKAERARRVLSPELAAVLGLEGVKRRWYAALTAIEAHARLGRPTDTYDHNEELWHATAAVAVTISVIDDLPLRFDLVLRDLGAQRRNARTLDLNRASFDANWRFLHAQLAQVRGNDAPPPGPDASADVTVPRTTNADVRLLAAYWDAAWRKLNDAWVRGEVTNRTTDTIELPQVRERWQAVMTDVDAAGAAKQGDLYAKNPEFWRASLAVKDALNAFHQQPPPTQLTFDAPADLWKRITGGVAEVARTVSDTVSETVGSVAHAVNNVSKGAGEHAVEGFLLRFKTPLLVGGGMLGALALYFLFRSSPHHEAALHHEAA